MFWGSSKGTGAARSETSEPAGDGGAGLMFWLLIAMSVVVFAPCMILPTWREYQLAELTERVRGEQATLAEKEVARLQARLDAIHNDPAVVARLARRELHFRAPDETVVPILVPSPVPFTTASPQAVDIDLTPVAPPVPVARLASYLPEANYDRLFCESPVRETLLGLSVALFVAAFAVFWPRHDEPTSAHA